jgi:hypothetical protein
MSERIRYHLDENVSLAIAQGLRRSGIDVTLPKEVGLLGKSDRCHCFTAIANGGYCAYSFDPWYLP